jgi:hypothetical protein
MAKLSEKDYAKIAKEKMHRPAEIQRKPKILVYARNKKGKTTFGLSAGVDKTLVLDPEHGTDEMKKSNPHVWPIERWEDLDDAINFARFDATCRICPTPHKFEWLLVDGLTKMSNMSLKYVMKLQEEKSLDRIPGLVQQRDYGKSGELMKDMLTRLHAMPMGVIYTVQERQDGAYDDSDEDDIEDSAVAYIPDLPRGVRGVSNSLVDVIGRLYVVKLDGDEGKPKAERRLYIGESVKYDTGYRSDFVLPDVIRQPTIPKLVRLMRTGSARPATAKTAAKKTSS